MTEGDLVQARYTMGDSDEWFDATYIDYTQGSHNVKSINGPFDGKVHVDFVRVPIEKEKKKEQLPCDETCPKCGFGDINMDYKELNKKYVNLKSIDDNYYKMNLVNSVVVIKEHLRCSCRNCQYQFILDVRK